MNSNDVEKGTALWATYQTARSDYEIAEYELAGAVDTADCGVELDTSGYYKRSERTFKKRQVALEEFRAFCSETYGDIGLAMLDEFLEATTALKDAYSTAHWREREYRQNFVRYYGDKRLEKMSRKIDQATQALSLANERLERARTALDNLTAGVS